MTIYADYRFYTTEYLGEKLSETQFDKYAQRATLYIENHFDGDIESALEADEDLNERLSFCTCELAEAMLDGNRPTVTSVSNDGYSESYQVKESDVVYGEILAMYLDQYVDSGVVRFL